MIDMRNPIKKYTVSGTIHNKPATRENRGKIHSTFDFSLRNRSFLGESYSDKTSPMPVDVCISKYRRKSIEILQKGANITMEGFFQPQTTTLSNGFEFHHIVFVAEKFYVTPASENPT